MDSLEKLLKDNEPVTILSICTKWSSNAHKFLMTDGMVHYGDELVTPEEVVSRFPADYPLLTYICAHVITKHVGDFDGKSYRWETNQKV